MISLIRWLWARYYLDQHGICLKCGAQREWPEGYSDGEPFWKICSSPTCEKIRREKYLRRKGKKETKQNKKNEKHLSKLKKAKQIFKFGL